MIVLVLLVVLSCKKHEVQETKFVVTLTQQSNNGILLKWDAITLSGYKNVNIYRSTSPIPDPTFDKGIDGGLLIASITDKTVSSFIDSNIVIGNNGTMYYKLVLNLTNRFLVSDLQQTTLNAFSIALPSNQFSSSSFVVTMFPEINVFYVLNYNQGTISVIDYTQKKILITANFSGGTTILYPIINAGKSELFVNTNNSISCYDALTLASKYSISVPSGAKDFKIKNNFLYVLTQNNSIRTYDLSTQSFIKEKYFNVGSGNYCNLLAGTLGNAVYLKYLTQYYNNQIGNYVYKNIVLSNNLVNNLPADSVVLNIAALNLDTLTYNSNSYSYIQLSPDGKYLTCNVGGDIYSFADHTTHSAKSANNITPLIVYSNDGKYLLGKPSSFSGISFDLMDIYSLPGFNLVTSLRSQNSGTVVFAGDFMDNDTLVSCNIKQSFQSGQNANSLTVLFKKID